MSNENNQVIKTIGDCIPTTITQNSGKAYDLLISAGSIDVLINALFDICRMASEANPELEETYTKKLNEVMQDIIDRDCVGSYMTKSYEEQENKE